MERSQTAAHRLHETHPGKTAVPSVAPGTAWFGGMVAVRSVFFTLLAASPTTLDGVHDWLVGLPIVWEILMWIVTLPRALAYVLWESSWDQWLRILLVVLVAGFHLLISAPRVR